MIVAATIAAVTALLAAAVERMRAHRHRAAFARLRGWRDAPRVMRLHSVTIDFDGDDGDDDDDDVTRVFAVRRNRGLRTVSGELPHRS